MLSTLVERVWLPEGDSPRWPVRVTSGAIPPGHRVVERYAVVPGPKHPRFLVPLDNQAVAAGCLTHYNGLRWARLRIPRTILGAAFHIGVGPILLRHRLLVCVPDDLSADEYAEYLLSAHLRQVLGFPDAVLGVGVRPPDPNVKPTLQLLDADGVPVAYAKIGWNAATRDMVNREASAISALTDTAPVAGQLLADEDVAGDGTVGHVQVPLLLHRGRWRDYQITVTAPLPPAVRRYRAVDKPPPLPYGEGAFATRSAKLADTRFWHAIRAETALLKTDDDEKRLGALAAARCDAVEGKHGATFLRVARWHGDWVPWNMGLHDGRLHVWDWEHSTAEAPVGFDHLHWRFQVCLVLRGRPLAEAVAAVRVGADELVGVSSEERELLAKLYLLEMFMRTYRLKRLGGGWNPALYPAMFDALEAL